MNLLNSQPFARFSNRVREYFSRSKCSQYSDRATPPCGWDQAAGAMVHIHPFLVVRGIHCGGTGSPGKSRSSLRAGAYFAGWTPYVIFRRLWGRWRHHHWSSLGGRRLVVVVSFIHIPLWRFMFRGTLLGAPPVLVGKYPTSGVLSTLLVATNSVP